jgi:hypothetical protein
MIFAITIIESMRESKCRPHRILGKKKRKEREERERERREKCC